MGGCVMRMMINRYTCKAEEDRPPSRWEIRLQGHLRTFAERPGLTQCHKHVTSEVEGTSGANAPVMGTTCDRVSSHNIYRAVLDRESGYKRGF